MAENALTTIAQRTGGRVFAPSLGAALDHAFSEIIRELRTQYLIAYYPKDVPLNKDRFHTLDVRSRDTNLHITARNGYYGESLQDAAAAASPSAGRIDVSNDETVRPRKPKVIAKPVKPE